MAKTKKKNKQKSSSLPLISITIFVIGLIIVGTIYFIKNPTNEYIKTFDEKYNLLLDKYKQSDVEIKYTPCQNGDYVVFLSICDTNNKALVFTGKGLEVDKAFIDARDKCIKYIKNNNYDTVWLKADVVTKTKTSNEYLFKDDLNSYDEFFRYGISLDDNYDCAFLESELNANDLIDYDNKTLKLESINNYLTKNNKDAIDELPVIFNYFTCAGFFCDENLNVYELSDEGLSYGRRIIDNIDQEFTYNLITNASNYLFDQIKEDGSFVYGVYPCFDEEIDDYNFVRHAGTIWSLILEYRLTNDASIMPMIDKVIDYMIDKAIVYKDENTAYLSEPKANEIKLGGNGVAILTLCEYMEVFNSDKYLDLANKLANGILTMQDKTTGAYVHVFDLDYNLKAQYRTVYYDGEATFALTKLYGLNHDQKLLDAAKLTVNHFIETDYTKYKDHWVEYALNEITKYCPDEEYYNFALKNIKVNLDTIYNQQTTWHTFLELLMSGFEIYDRIITTNANCSYLNEFDINELLNTINKRVDVMLNGYFFPEYSMYMQNPKSITNTFMVRHDDYRVRIDDVQHNIDGYYMYYKNYNKLLEYGLYN